MVAFYVHVKSVSCSCGVVVGEVHAELFRESFDAFRNRVLVFRMSTALHVLKNITTVTESNKLIHGISMRL
jgi:hypothetical protein